MLEELESLREGALGELEKLSKANDIEAWVKNYTGRKSKLTEILRNIKDLPAEEKGKVGKRANEVRIELEQAGNAKLAKLKALELEEQLQTEFLDITLPGIPSGIGGLHPITQEIEKIVDIFDSMGFKVEIPYLIDDDYHNFTSINIPEGHPARDMWDTMRIDDDKVLITHTSSMQNRIIRGTESPVRAIVPGKCFRSEATDARHEHSFFQVEGVYIDKGIKLSDLIGTLKQFLVYYFEREMEVKLQPTFFPFVEPGLELMMSCPVCNGEKPANCEGCGGSGWMEVIPCGPIHPFVTKEAGLDPEIYSGFAWGMGLDRLIMIKNGINDIRHFHSGRLDFVKQFN